MNRLGWIGFVCLALGGVSACSSTQEVRQQDYAVLSNQDTFEEEFGLVWKAIEETVRNYTVLEKDPDFVSPKEMKHLAERTLRTDWVYGQSNDKYVTYQIKGSPRKKYLQARFQYEIKANRVVGGTLVTIEVKEEVQHLNQDGSSAGYVSAEKVDSRRVNDLLKKIKLNCPPHL